MATMSVAELGLHLTARHRTQLDRLNWQLLSELMNLHGLWMKQTVSQVSLSALSGDTIYSVPV